MQFSLGDVIVSMFWFMLLFAWIWLLIAILSDIFRDHGMSGWGKAGWTLFIIAVPWLGALVYLIARGSSMNERARQQALRQEEQMRQYVRDVAPPVTSTSAELAKLADLHQRGVLDAAEYAQAKAGVLAGTPSPAGLAPADDTQPGASQPGTTPRQPV